MNPWLLAAMLVVAGCCPSRNIDPAQAARDAEELERKMAAQKARDDAARSARPEASPAPIESSAVAEVEALKKARAQDATAAAAERRAFAEKIKRSARCASAVVEGDQAETLHTEGCDAFEPPATNSGPFEEAKRLGFERIHNRSIGKAMCSYYLAQFPQQKVWKCAAGSWPGP